MPASDSKRSLAEFFATYILVLVGTGAIVLNDKYAGAISHLGVSAAFGLIVFLMIFFFGMYSGAHMNPAVTLTLAWRNKFPLKQSCFYVLAQITGALLASLTLKWFFPDHTNLGATLPRGDWPLSFLLEFCMSFGLMLVVLWVSERKNMSIASAGFFIGLIVFLEAYFGGPISGASMNPARSLGPALVSGQTQFLWIYLLAPNLGMLVAGVMHPRRMQ